ncbi:MAG: right-handed parallel beta-helix repeat-containing protein, partial [Bacteroidales bacterium]|nr:right-handed parallel beta-helix repeat-containing protein [Bacteroidales bacterium]
MKKVFIILLGITLAMPLLHSQTVRTWTENFDGNTVSFSSTPPTAWERDVIHSSPPYAYLGNVPNMPGGTAILETPPYDLRGAADYIYLRFKHICKISPLDIVRIEYKLSAQQWQPIPAIAYEGKLYNYVQNGFNAASYSEWNAGDSLAVPTQSWWKEESFNVSFETRGDAAVQFRFIIQHGDAPGTQISYGWLLDDVEIIVSNYERKLPIVEITSSVPDTVYTTGPHAIYAKVQTQTAAPLVAPYLKYMATNNGTLVGADSVLMSSMSADNSVWQALIPQFDTGTTVVYSITAKDTNENQATDSSKYVIAMLTGTSKTATIGNGTTNGYSVPFATQYRYSWSRQLYLASEIDANSSGGLITRLAWEYGSAFSIFRYKQTCYLGAVDETRITTGGFNPLTDGATQVWTGGITFSNGWCEIELDNPFFLPPGKNLMVYWEHREGAYNGGAFKYHGASSQAVHALSDNYFPGGDGGSLGTARANIRLFMEGAPTNANSVALRSIDISDTVITAQGLSCPVIANIKNKGTADLDSAVLSFSINGAAPVSKTWHGKLQWDRNTQFTIDNYYPKANGYDTIKMWVSKPNGVTDAVITDDTLTKIIFGSSDILMSFVSVPLNTAFETGPFPIHARIVSLTGVVLDSIWLKVNTTHNGNITADSFLMNFDNSDNLWKTEIPMSEYGSNIDYSISLIDILNNSVHIGGNFLVKRAAINEIVDTYIFGDITDLPVLGNTVYATNLNTSWTRFLYMANEITADNRDLNIAKLAWYNPTTTQGQTRTKFTVHMKATSLLVHDQTYAEPSAEGATLVYSGNITAKRGWNEINLIKPFLLPKGSNLMIYFEDKTGSIPSPNTQIIWAASESQATNVIEFYGSVFGWEIAPVLRFSMAGTCLLDSNSVALDKILPKSQDIIPGSPNHIQAIIRNRGIKDLTSCTINWTLDGMPQTPYLWTGNLLEDHIDTVTLGTYTPSMGDRNVVKVWVSIPNGITDPTNDDDTLRTELTVCGNGLAGRYIIGSSSSANYATIDAAFSTIQTCGIDNKVILAFESGTYNLSTYLNLEDISDYMDITDTLVLTSVAGKADSVILKSPNGAIGFRFSNNRNIIVQGITIDATAGTYAIQFVLGCSNIVIRDCHLLADPTATASTKTVIYKFSVGTGALYDFYMINNLIDGGYQGIHLQNGYDVNYNVIYNGRIIMDSNTFSNNYNGAIYIAGGLMHCTHNTILSRITDVTAWTGIYGPYGPADYRYVGNRIIQRSANINTATGMQFLSSTGYNTSDTTLIANNEIILSSSVSGKGIMFQQGKILNNSIYISGAGTGTGTNVSAGIYASSGAIQGVIKNNNIIMLAPTGTPFYSSAANIYSSMDIDYNNTYNLTEYMCLGTPALTQKAWKEAVLTDVHSTRIFPDFVDPTTSLKLASYATDLFCPIIYPVNVDIDSIKREGITLKGCYGLAPATANASLTAIEGLQQGLVTGQTDSAKVVLYNTGATQLTSVDLGWSVNNVTQNGNITVPVSLTQGQSATLGLGTITYPVGNVTVKIWINSLNGGGATDGNRSDDTITMSIYVCSGAFSGLVTIGTTGAFPNFKAAYNAMQLCGVSGDVTMAFQNGTYTGNLDLFNSADLLGNHSLTLTSVSGDTADVIFDVKTFDPILCNNTNNLILKDITIDATKGNYAVQFTGAASNITIDNCHILANPTVKYITASGNNPYGAGIYKASNTGALNGLTIKNCVIDGGYAGIYIFGLNTNYCQNIVIDSNTITNQDYQGIFLTYVSANSISYNRITPRSVNQNVSWYSMYANYLRNGGNIIGNRISANNPSILTLYGMYLISMDTALIANNEIYLNGGSASIYGINIDNPRQVRIINNTVYTVKVGNTGTNYAHYNYIRSGYSSEIKNNIFAASGGAIETTAAFYFAGTAADFTTYGSDYDVDYNNYYSTGTNIGYVAGSNHIDLAAWKTAISPLDQHSVNVFPNFANLSNGLALASYSDTLLSPRWGTVDKDIRNMDRPVSTLMGAYTQFIMGRDLALVELSSWNPDVIQKQTVPINVVLMNNGTVPITNIELGWSLNGGQPTIVQRTLTPSLDSLAERTVNIGSFLVSNTIPNYNVVVWISKVNNQADTVKWNDTIRASSSLNVLAEFVAPFVPDTIIDLSFTVNARINSQSGATINTPKITIVSTVHRTTIIYDTVPMTLDKGLWHAVIPPQYYGTKVIYSLFLSDTVGNNITLTDSTYIRSALSILGDPALVTSLSLEEPLNTTGCMPDYTPVKISLANQGTKDYDFAKDTVLFGLEIIDADTILHTFSVPFSGVLESGTNIIELVSSFPTIHPGAYYIKSWISSSTDNTPYMDTLRYTYISGKIGLPIDEYFNSSIPLEFDVWGNSSLWTVVPQGTGADTVVKPVFGSGMLSFTGSRGAMSTLTTRQMDLSRTINPTLSFWYFHDTLPSKDYTDVRLTVDGRITHTNLLSLTKYDTVYG